jgi:hypothetical protein
MHENAAILATGRVLSASAVTSPAMTAPVVAAVPAPWFEFLAMTKRGKSEKGAVRSERLSAALRENLKRRKAQAREREQSRGSAPGTAAEGVLSPSEAETDGSPEFRRNPVRE